MQAAGYLRRRADIKAEAAVLAFISTWEAVALTVGVVPTVTSTVMRCPRAVRAALVAGVSCWLVTHFELRAQR